MILAPAWEQGNGLTGRSGPVCRLDVKLLRAPVGVLEQRAGTMEPLSENMHISEPPGTEQGMNVGAGSL